jgi:hypothetical protein
MLYALCCRATWIQRIFIAVAPGLHAWTKPHKAKSGTLAVLCHSANSPIAYTLPFFNPATLSNPRPATPTLSYTYPHHLLALPHRLPRLRSQSPSTPSPFRPGPSSKQHSPLCPPLDPVLRPHWLLLTFSLLFFATAPWLTLNRLHPTDLNAD